LDSNRHCGHYKGGDYDSALFSSPHDPATVRLLRYLPDAHVEPGNSLSTEDQAKAEYLIRLLNLNCPRLVSKRHTHARQMITTLGSSPLRDIRSWAEDYYLNHDASGSFKEFHSLSREVLLK